MLQKFLLSLLICSAVITMSFTLQKRKKVVFFGDSITQMGAEPGGYIRQMESIIAREGMNNQYELVGAGISGNKVTDLYLRLERDVLSKQPDIVVMYVGINDVWHKRLAGTGTDYVKYTEFYDAIVKKLQLIVVLMLILLDFLNKLTDVASV